MDAKCLLLHTSGNKFHKFNMEIDVHSISGIHFCSQKCEGT